MILTDADELRAALRQALEERDEARAEVERLRDENRKLYNSLQGADSGMTVALREVAERQREACASNMHPLLRSMLSRRQAADLCLETPLVTEVGE